MLLTSIETRGAGDFSTAHDSCPLEVFCALLYNNVKQRDSLASTVIRLRMEASDFSPVYSISDRRPEISKGFPGCDLVSAEIVLPTIWVYNSNPETVSRLFG